MHGLIIVSAVLAPIVAAASIMEVQQEHPRATLLYVSPAGDDAADGSKTNPLKTLAGARDRVRKLLAARKTPAIVWRDDTYNRKTGVLQPSGNPVQDGGIIVTFADGVYPISETVEFDRRDSATPETPVVYVAEHCGKAVFDGGIALDWRPLAETDERYALIPVASRGKVVVGTIPGDRKLPGFFTADRYMHRQQLGKVEDQLSVYDLGCRCEVARWPNGEVSGRLRGASKTVNAGYPMVYEGTAFRLEDPSGAKADYAALAGEPDLWANGSWRHWYAGKCVPVRAEGDRFVVRDGETIDDCVRHDRGAYLLNAFTQLDREDEWAVDRKARKIYVWPRSAQGPVVAFTTTLVKLADVNDVAFEGFVFRHARGDMVKLERCRDVSVRKSELKHGSRFAVTVVNGRDCRVEGCDVFDFGEGGVMLVGGDHDTLAPARHVADNNRIHRYGRTSWNYNPGVMVEGTGCRVTHNLVYDSKHQAFTWNGNDHYFGYNICHDVCTWNEDAGAIYGYHTFDAHSRRGTTIEYNVFYATGRRPKSSQTVAVYVDAFTSGMRIRGNIVNRATLGIFSSGGQDNLVERNLVVNCNEGIRRWNLGVMGGRTPHPRTLGGRFSPVQQPLRDQLDLYSGEFWTSRYPKMLQPLGFEDEIRAHGALFCNFRDNVVCASGKLVIEDEAETRGYTDVNGNVEVDDPGFIDYYGMNWELRDDSPARKTLGGGTRFGEMGLYESPLRFSAAVKWGETAWRPDAFKRPTNSANSRIDIHLDAPESMAVAEGKVDENYFAELGEGAYCHPWYPQTIVCGFEDSDYADWKQYTCTFTPKKDCAIVLIVNGYAGEPTLYDDFRLDGKPLPNGGFEEDGAWTGPVKGLDSGKGTPVYPESGIVREWGGAKPYEGTRMLAANDARTFKQRIELKGGRPVTITYWARGAEAK